MKLPSTNRRRFLGWSAATAASTLGVMGSTVGTGGLSSLLMSARPAQAADNYKALVCVFLYGGNDGMNTIVPTDTRYSQYSAVRKSLALPQSSLIGLSGAPFGLHPSLAPLEPIWSAGKLATIFNVGSLAQPLDKATFRAATGGSGTVPDSLFSHSDQQLEWQAATATALTRTGWGGRAADVLNTAQPVINLGGNAPFGLSASRAQLVLPGPGDYFGAYGLNDPWADSIKRKDALDALYATDAQDVTLSQAFSTQMRDAFSVSATLEPVVKQQPGDTDASVQAIDAAFASLISNGQVQGSLARQLYQAAKLIANHGTVGGAQQIYFTELGGFDTHGGQIGDTALVGLHASLLAQLGQSLAAFHNAMVNLGLSQQVTVFTQSDFGRTFVPNNSSGTDHAWGNHHFVLGGAVHGGTYGSYPNLQLGGPDDVGVQSWELQGRWIPSTSVDQYSAPLLTWLGANSTQLSSILPNLSRFASQPLPAFI